jgi:glycosyltransferase involved in cell wall biosynthesis
MMNESLVSVILPTYNGFSRGFLDEAVRSVLAQTQKRFELIIVDDGSTDDIAEGCQDCLRDGRVRIIRRENGGLSAARMTGIENSRGEYIALLDDDDRWHPDMLLRQLEFLDSLKDPQAAMVFCGIRLIDAQGKGIGARRRKAVGDIYQRLIVNGNGITAPSAVIFKRSVIDAVGNFDPAMRSLEDLDLWLRIARRYHIYSMPDLLCDYRLHDNTITAKSFAREEEYERKLYERVLADEPGLDRRTIFRNMFRRFAVRHLSLGNYAEARKALKDSLGQGFSLESFALFVLAGFPAGILNMVRSLRRRLRLLFFRGGE